MNYIYVAEMLSLYSLAGNTIAKMIPTPQNGMRLRA